MTKYVVALTAETGWEAYLTTQEYEVEAQNAEAAEVAARQQARERYAYEHANNGTAQVREV